MTVCDDLSHKLTMKLLAYVDDLGEMTVSGHWQEPLVVDGRDTGYDLNIYEFTCDVRLGDRKTNVSFKVSHSPFGSVMDRVGVENHTGKRFNLDSNDIKQVLFGYGRH